jgi:hypothetical protein
MIKNKYDFTIDNNISTCYIDALLIAMFYKKNTYIDNILNFKPKDNKFIYLQEIIKHKFLNKIRNNISITINSIKELKILIQFLSKCKILDDPYEYNIPKFYDWLLNAFDVQPININNNLLTPHLDFNILSHSNYNVKALLSEFSSTNEINLINNHLFIGIAFNRSDTNKSKIDIMKRIKIYDKKNAKWIIHSIICQKNIDNLIHYYSLIHISDNNWILYDDLNIPCIQDLNIKDTDKAAEIMSEVIFALYCCEDQ